MPGSPIVVVLNVDTPARVETWVDVELASPKGRKPIAKIVIPRNRWSYWNHSWRHEQRLLEMPSDVLQELGPAGLSLRASAQPGPVWLWRRAPVTVVVPIG